jgi:dienelactone hydrolase
MVLFALLFALCVLGADAAVPYVHAVRLLRTVESGKAAQAISRDLMLSSDSELQIRAREYFYSPLEAQHAPVLVLVHGVHHLGVDEPRLQRFARALAHEGVHVITPEIPGAKDYRVAPEDITVIGESGLATRRLTGAKEVGVMGFSFSGGLSLMAAADPRYASSVRYVIAVGAHDSMQRVADFFGRGRMVEPDGREVAFAPHEYGPLVMVYVHPEDYFPAEQAEQVRGVLRAHLYGNGEAERKALAELAQPSRSKLEAWLTGKQAGLGEQIVAAEGKRVAEFEQVSPHGHLAGLKARVLLLHGEGDNVIPPSETKFLAGDIPQDLLEMALVSPALSHVELKKPGMWEKVRLVRWMAAMFREVEGSE